MANPLVNEHLQLFLTQLQSLRQLYSVRELFPYTFVIAPQDVSTKTPPGKDIALTLFGLIHGNEVVGIAILNEILSLMISGQVVLTFPLAVALGNYRAVLQGARYLEKDLNRSFGANKGSAWEIDRAEELASLLGKSWFFVDFHQTSQPSLEAFFIFPYSRENVHFAHDLCPTQPIITHWHGGFSSDGKSSDEFVTEHGGVGVTLETGQNGFSSYQIGLGAMVGLRAFAVVSRHLREYQAGRTPPRGKPSYPTLYTWLHVQEYPRGEVVLRPGLVNFQTVKKGEELGRCDGKPLCATESGILLFPKYLDPVIDQGRRPAELWRIIAPVQASDLPDW